MKFVFASDSFKGSLSSERIGRLLEIAARSVYSDCDIVIVPIADGGEGTLDAVLSATESRKETITVHDPLGRPVKASYGLMNDGSALIEMAQASGLTLISERERNPLLATSKGTGEMIRDALKKGCKRITISIGGSATNDGGMGCMSELGIRFLDKNGRRLEGNGATLADLCSIDMTGLMKEVPDASFSVMCDVTNPLCGPDGATYTYGPQKGADPKKLSELESGMQNYRDVIQSTFGIDCDAIAGAGAAGGMGAALKVFLNATLESGIRALLRLVRFEEIIKDADLIVTGEGRADEQSCHGKVMQGIGLAAKKAGVPVVALCGTVEPEAEKLKEFGINAFYESKPSGMSIEEAMEKAGELYLTAATEMFEDIRRREL